VQHGAEETTLKDLHIGRVENARDLKGSVEFSTSKIMIKTV